MRILVIDGQGGKIGAQLVKLIKSRFPSAELTAVGTNALATSAMLKAGAENIATGENAVCVAVRRTDLIVGPIGIVIADAMLGEVTPKMAAAVAQSDVKRILIPFSNCYNVVAGVSNFSIKYMLGCVADEIETVLKGAGDCGGPVEV